MVQFCLACVAWKRWAQEKTGAREGDTRGDFSSHHPRVSPSREAVLSLVHYFQAPATQAKFCY